MTDQVPDYFDVLGVRRGASAAELSKAKKKQAKKHHSDHLGGDEEAMKQVNHAFDILSDPEECKAYEAVLDRQARKKEKAERARARARGKSAGSVFSEELKDSLAREQGQQQSPRPSQPQPSTAPRSSAQPPAPSRSVRRQWSTSPSARVAPAGPPHESATRAGAWRRLSRRIGSGESIIERFLALLAAMVFTACPILLMAASISASGKDGGHGGLNVMDFLLLIIGPVCFVWVFAGLAAVGIAAWMLLVALITFVARWGRRLPLRWLALLTGGVVVSVWLASSILSGHSGGSPLSGAGLSRAAHSPALKELQTAIAEQERAENSVSEEKKDEWDEEATRHVPPPSFGVCGKTNALDTAAIRAYSCRPEGVPTTLEYFASPHEANRALLERAAELESLRAGSACSKGEVPALEEFVVSDPHLVTEGFVLCFVRAGHIEYVWTNTTEAEVRYTQATFRNLDTNAAKRWWQGVNKGL